MNGSSWNVAVGWQIDPCLARLYGDGSIKVVVEQYLPPKYSIELSAKHSLIRSR